MRINSAGSSDSDIKDRDVNDSQGKDKKDEPSVFSRVLAKKHGGGQETENLKHGGSAGNDDAVAAGMLPQEQLFERSMQPEQVRSAHMVEVPAELQSLIREIAVVARGQQVNIELNSNVLKGLHISISQQNGGVAIQFQSSSEQVAALLSKNVDALSQGLADRGVNVADIRITPPSETQKQSAKFGSTFGGRPAMGRSGRR